MPDSSPYTHTDMNKLSSYMCVSSAGWFVLMALLVIAMFSSSCASSGYCKSWNNPAGQVAPADLSDKG